MCLYGAMKAVMTVVFGYTECRCKVYLHFWCIEMCCLNSLSVLVIGFGLAQVWQIFTVAIWFLVGFWLYGQPVTNVYNVICLLVYCISEYFDYEG